MARRPSQKSIDLYNRLVEQASQVRKKLKRIHKRAEEAFGAGRLPALIIPKASHKVRMSQFQGLSSAELHRRLKAYWSNLANLKEMFAVGLKTYLARTVKDGYMNLWLDQIRDFTGETPEVFRNHLFSKEQIENSKFGDFMKTYNRLFMLSPESFLALLYTGRMLSFKFIYQEMKSVGERDSMAGSWLQEQNELLNLKDEKLSEKTMKEWLRNIGRVKGQTKTISEANEEDEATRLDRAYKSGKHGVRYQSKYKEVKR